jgi:hypothetical protein
MVKRTTFVLAISLVMMGGVVMAAHHDSGSDRDGYKMEACYKCNTKKGQKDTFRKGSEHEEKLCKTIGFLLSHSESLSLSDGQIKDLKVLKVETKKNMIRFNSDIELIMVDIKSETHQDKVNLNELNKLIDNKYAFKKAKAKELVKSFEELKKIVTKEQQEKAKGMMRGSKGKNHPH